MQRQNRDVNIKVIPSHHYHYQQLWFLVQHKQPQVQEVSPRSSEIVQHQDDIERTQNHGPAKVYAYSRSHQQAQRKRNPEKNLSND